jgi:predicted lipoprotein with Yx(FWY)xxD motif
VILMQITGVQTLEDSPAVTVKFFHAADVMPKNQTGGILSFASYRIDGNPLYGTAAKGRIKNGVLTTEPTDVHLPFFGNRVETEFFIRGLRLELKLTDDAATGLLGGYHDLDNWWDYVRKMGYLIETAQFSCPALYTAAVEMADGYPDPKTGNCTALSVAYKIEAARAFVIETPKPLPAATVLATSPLEATNAPPGITVGKVTNGEVLTTAEGKTLYMSAAGCTGKCAETFAPMKAPWSAGPIGPWTITALPDQTRQWTYAGQGVFTCLQDRHAGDVTCTRDGWRPMAIGTRAGLPSWMTIQPSEVGAIVADKDGRTLYRLLGDAAKFKTEICDDTCMAAQWRPVTAAGETVPIGPFKVAEADGKQVWQYFGRTLYTYAGDKSPGQIGGHRFGGASVGARNWFTAITIDDALSTTQPPLSRPAE